MAVVDHRQRVMFTGEFTDRAEVGDRTVHREHAIGHDQAIIAVLGGIELCLQVTHIVVLIAKSLRFGQPHAINDAGVIQGVRNDRILFPENSLEEPAIGVKTGRIKDGVLCTQILTDTMLKLLVERLGSTYEAH